VFSCISAAAVALPLFSSLLVKLFLSNVKLNPSCSFLLDQINRLARVFSFPGVTNECAPSLTAFKMSHIPVEYRSEKALTRVFAQWKPNIALSDGTAVVTITDPLAGEGATDCWV